MQELILGFGVQVRTLETQWSMIGVVRFKADEKRLKKLLHAWTVSHVFKNFFINFDVQLAIAAQDMSISEGSDLF